MGNCFVLFWQMVKNFNTTDKIEMAAVEMIISFVRDYKSVKTASEPCLRPRCV